MIVELRDEFLNYQVVNKKYNQDISSSLVLGPEHVLIHLADYIDILEKQNKRYREALEKIKNKISKQLEGLDAEEEMQRVVELSELMTMTIEALEGEE